MKEYDFIRRMFPDIPLFDSDAQIMSLGGQEWGISCDTFSLEEDLFTGENPGRLGRNLVTATLGDLVATGCEPAFYLHAITFGDESEPWCEALAGGIREALRERGCALLGGDTGRGRAFSYTGIALGPRQRAISRKLPPRDQKLWVSGPLGDVNLSVLRGEPTPEFEVRSLPEGALACIDTSSGFMDAVWQLHEQNPGFCLELRDVPAPDVSLLFGAGGEYELLISADGPCPDCVAVGEAVFGGEGVYLDGYRIPGPPEDPRDFASVEEYITALRRQIGEIFRPENRRARND